MFLIFIPAALLFRSQSLSEAWLAVSGIFTRFASLPEAFALIGMDGLAFVQIALSIVCMGMVWHFCRERQVEEAADSPSLAASEGAFLVADVTGGAPQAAGSAAGGASAQISLPAAPLAGRMLRRESAWEDVAAHAFLILSVMVCWLAFLASNDASTFAYFQF